MGNGIPSLVRRIGITLMTVALLAPVQLISSDCRCKQSSQSTADKTTANCCLEFGPQSTNNSEAHYCAGAHDTGRFGMQEDCRCAMNDAGAQSVALELFQVWPSGQKAKSFAALVPAFDISLSQYLFLSDFLCEKPPSIKFLPLSSTSTPLRI
jgi:hypothetical protein